MNDVQAGAQPRRGRLSPVVSLSTLARLMGPVTPAKQFALLRGHKFPTEGPKRSYQNATKQAVDFLIDGRPFDANATNLRDYEREAVIALASNPPGLPPDVIARRPAPNAPKWSIGGVEISTYPDAETSGPLGEGAIKFVMAKEPLPHGVGAKLAALLWHHRSVVLGRTTNPRACVVHEPRVRGVYTPSAHPEKQVQSVEQVCRIIGALWPHVTE